MTTRASVKNGRSKKPLETTLGKATSYSSDSSIDLSHVRKPIDTSIFGLRQVLTLFETATDEVRRYIMYECDIMYECRTCRSIYRSLANFVLHKRNYCRESYNANDHTNCRNNCQENEFIVYEEEQEAPISHPKRQKSRENSPQPGKNESKRKQASETSRTSPEICSSQELKEPKKKLNSVLHRLMDKQTSTMITKQCMDEDISDESKSSNDKVESKNNVALQKINDSNTGVFQTMFRNMIEENKKMDFMKTEVMEIHDILENNEAIIGSDGKVIISDAEKNAVLKNNFTCTICNQKFSTRKTLSYHIKYKHNNSRLIYQCPECNDSFPNTWGVFRHLYKVHRKTIAQVKRLRSQIHANIMRRDEQPAPKESDSPKTNSVLPPDLQGQLDIENQQWMDDFEGHNDLQRCGGCGRKFERKAALHSHSQFCTKRIAVCNTIKENTAKRAQTEEKSTKSSKTSNFSIQENVKRLNRRKPLVSRKIYRIDYFENDKVNIETCVQEISHEKKDFAGKKEISKDDSKILDEDSKTDIKIVTEKVEEIIKIEDKIVQDCKSEDVSIINSSTSIDGNKKRRASTESCDDVIYVNTIPYSATTSLENSEDNSNHNFTSSKTIKQELSLTKFSTANSSIDNELYTVNLALDPEPDSDIKLSGKEFVELSETLKNNFIEIAHKPNDKGTQNSFINSKHKQDNELRKFVHEKQNIPVNRVKKKHKSSLEIKSSRYIEKQKRMCRPCNRSFKSFKSLMKHMAVHFNWHRYECKSCSYKSYTRSKCERHVENQHGISSQEKLKEIVVRMSNLKALEICTDFKEHHKRNKFNDIGEDEACARSVDVSKEIKNGSYLLQDADKLCISTNNTEVDSIEDSKHHHQIPHTQDPSLRKMIMEVIFGSSSDSSQSQCEIDANSSSEIMDTTPQDVPETHLPSENDDVKLEQQDCDGLKTSTALQESVSEPLTTSEASKDQRPVRNRVTPVQKDFLYDMKQILKPTSTFHKDTNKKKKCLKVNNVKKTKLKLNEMLHVASTIPGSNKITIVKGDNTIPPKHIKAVQDVNMNSPELLKNKHITGDFV